MAGHHINFDHVLICSHQLHANPLSRSFKLHWDVGATHYDFCSHSHFNHFLSNLCFFKWLHGKNCFSSALYFNQWNRTGWLVSSLCVHDWLSGCILLVCRLRSFWPFGRGDKKSISQCSSWHPLHLRGIRTHRSLLSTVPVGCCSRKCAGVSWTQQSFSFPHLHTVHVFDWNSFAVHFVDCECLFQWK